MKKLLIALVLLPTLVYAQPYTPPTGSRAANGVWPRLIITPDNRAAIRSYINSNYSSDFQTFLNKLGTGIASGNAEKVYENTWAPINYSFPVALGVQELKDLGYTFPAAFDTEGELCTEAYRQFSTDITDINCAYGVCRSIKYGLMNTPMSTDTSGSTTTYMYRSDRGTYTLAGALMFDWCHSGLTTAQKQDIADSFYDRYTDVWSTLNLMTHNAHGASFTANERWPLFGNDLIFALTAWGDTDILDSTKRQTLYDTFYTAWINRTIWEIDWINDSGWNNYEGVDYWSYNHGMGIFAFAYTATDSALGTSYISSRPYFTEIGTGTAAWNWPEATGKTTGCNANGLGGCPVYTEDWGDNTYKLGIQSCRPSLLQPGILRFWGQSSEANVARWVWDNQVLQYTPGCASTNASVAYGTDVYFKFLFGIAGTTAVAPTRLNHKLGGRYYYIFKSGYTTDATHIFFGAPTWKSGGHDSGYTSHFTLRKYGPLIIKAGHWRDGVCTTSASGYNVQSSMGLQVGGLSDTDLGPDTTAGSIPAWSARGISDFANVVAEDPLDSFGSRYSYVFQDRDPAWNAATKMQREFTYLRGSTDHEYLIVIDRVNVSNTANLPVWKIWVPAQPTCVDGSCSNPRTGKWVSSGKILSMDNTASPANGVSTGGWKQPATSGKFFLKSVLPSDSTVWMVGDDGTATKNYQKFDDTGNSESWTNSSGCVTGTYPFTGWGRIEIRAGTVQNTNVFVNVIQFGSATSLQSMAPIANLNVAGDSNRIAMFVKDSEKSRIFAYLKDNAVASKEFTYYYTKNTSKSDHLLINMEPGQDYYINSVASKMFLGFVLTPIAVLPLVRKRRSIAIPLCFTILVSSIILYTFVPVTIEVQVSSTNNGGTKYTADNAGVISLELD